MSEEIARDSTDVERGEALAVVVANHGNVAAAAAELEMNESTLRSWVERYPDRYHEIEKRHGMELEAEVVARARAVARRASELEMEMLEKVGKIEGRESPQALRALADAGKKSADKVLALTGRPLAPKGGDSTLDTLRELAKAGLVKVNVDIGGDAPVDATVEEDDRPPTP